MRTPLAVATLIAATCAFAACGGGGSSTSPSVPATNTIGTTNSTSKATVTATLSIKFPPNFHIAKHAPAKGAKGGSLARAVASATRRAAYVNPTYGNIIDIYVNGNLLTALDGTNLSNDSITVGYNSYSDGTQVISFPLPTGQTNDVAVVEWDGTSHTNLLAVGEAPQTASFNPGDAPQILVQLQMNVQNVAWDDTPDGSDNPQLLSTSSTYYYCTSQTPTVYFFAADPVGGFAATPGVGLSASTGYGGTVLPFVSATQSSDSPASTLQPSNGGYNITYNFPYQSVTASVTVPNNPASGVFAATANTSFYVGGNLNGLASQVNTATSLSLQSGQIQGEFDYQFGNNNCEG